METIRYNDISGSCTCYVTMRIGTATNGVANPVEGWGWFKGIPYAK